MSTQGETNLDTLIASMQPEIHDAVFVFATVPADFQWQSLSPVMVFNESEGVTLILNQAVSKAAGIDSEFPCRMITLNIHSSLDAVGFLARITTTLAALGMGVNPVSGFYHDHLFVPVERAAEAMDALVAMGRYKNS